MSQSRANLQAAGLIAVAMLCFSGNDAIIKAIGAEIPVGQALAMRGITVLAGLLGFMWLRGERLRPSALKSRALRLRAGIDIAFAYTFLTGVTLLPLASVSALLFASPIILTFLAATVLKERVRLRRWLAVLAGFAGVMLIVAPWSGGQGWEWALLLPLSAAFLAASRDVVTRHIPAGIPSSTIAFTTACAVSLAGALSLPFARAPVDGPGFLLALAAGALVAVAYQTYVVAVRLGELSFIAPFRYFALLNAMFLGWVVFGEVPGLEVLLGAGIIVASGLFIWWRERRAGADHGSASPGRAVPG